MYRIIREQKTRKLVVMPLVMNRNPPPVRDHRRETLLSVHDHDHNYAIAPTYILITNRTSLTRRPPAVWHARGGQESPRPRQEVTSVLAELLFRYETLSRRKYTSES